MPEEAATDVEDVCIAAVTRQLWWPPLMGSGMGRNRGASPLTPRAGVAAARRGGNIAAERLHTLGRLGHGAGTVAMSAVAASNSLFYSTFQLLFASSDVLVHRRNKTSRIRA
jgi:hypothetical protein